MDQTSTTVFVKPKRTTFVTVLCILTFLGSAYGIFAGLLAYSKGPQISRANKEQRAKQESKPGTRKESEFDKKMDSEIAMFMDAEKIKQNAVASILTNAITFIGAFLMFRMNSKGFWVYVLGTVGGVIAPLVIFGHNSLANIFAYGSGFVGLIFIVMYAFNLRDMKPQPVYD
ncbi:MAG TPA: hypothetical protein VLL95_10370 [Phnomibacter sp.]|nr:hypothetical protein [Phnomibacter sp.]